MIRIENILNDTQFSELLNYICKDNSEWLYINSTVKEPKQDTEYIDSWQLVKPVFHNTVIDSYLFGLIMPIMMKVYKELNISDGQISRIKINSLHPNPNCDAGQPHALHQDDLDDNAVSCIFYLNNADGDTVLYNDSKITKFSPIENSAIVFPSKLWHASSSPIASERRLVVNIVFYSDIKVFD